MVKNLNLIKKSLFIIFVICLLFILVYNILHFDPILGYDAEAHYSYIDTFSRYLPDSFHLPTANESREFFSPPLPYIFPSSIQVICRNILSSQNLLEDCKPIYGKMTQIFQNILFLGSIYINLLTLRLFQEKRDFNFSFLILTMMLAANYRTLSIIKGEIYILFFLSILIYLLAKLEKNNFNYENRDILKFGIIIGLLALTRQWVFLIFPAFFIVYFKIKENKKNYLYFISLSLIVGFIISSWFYFYNLFRYGSLTAFNTEINKTINLERVSEFVSFDGISNYIFTNPIRPYFENKFLPIFYSDVWGDYWGYFTFTSRFLEVGRNQLNIGEYLGKVNLLSLITISIIFYFYFKTIKNSNSQTLLFINYSIILSFIGYFIWVLLYQTGTQGDTIKATYMTQAINLIVFISAISIEKIRKPRTYLSIIFVLVLIFAHNFQSYLSHFPMFFPN